MRRSAWIAFLSIVVLASALRLVNLTQRPMHTDEAVHAAKFKDLLEQGSYRYDPYEYHGPALNYLTLIPAWIQSASSISQIDETTLRIVPAVIGILAIVLLAFFYHRLQKRVWLCSAFLMATSPALVFFSRYYIQEMLLVTFSWMVIVFIRLFHLRRKTGYIIAAGFGLGMMHASKETAIINLFAMMVAYLATIRWMRKKTTEWPTRFPYAAVMLGLATAVAVSALFFSSFFQHGAGIIDSYATFMSYVERGVGQHQTHLYPCYKYLQWLIYNPAPGFRFWSEGFVVLFGLLGLITSIFSAFHDRFSLFYRFIALYTLVLMTLYSLIPYKTPWSMLSFYFGLLLLTPKGMFFVWKHINSWLFKRLYAVVLALFVAYQLWLCIVLNFYYPAHPSNPYVYGHTSPDIYTLVEKVERISRLHPDGKAMYIEVICPQYDYWPLPWYLRHFSRVGFWPDVSFDTPSASLIIAKPEVESLLLKKLYTVPKPGQRHLYLPLFDRKIELRAGVEIRAYIKKSLYDLYRRQSHESD